MSHPLQQRIRALRRRIVRLSAVRGLSSILAVVLATVIVLGATDWLLRFRERGVLVVFAAIVLGVLGLTGFLAVRKLLKTRLGETDLALHVETCFPAVKDRLASAVEFLRQSEEDPAAGSAAMRRVAIAQAAAAAEDLDFTTAVHALPALWWSVAALVIVLAATCLMVFATGATRTALARLAFPLGTAEWPQRTHLGLRQPVTTLVRGQPLEIDVIDTRDAPLPSDCQVHYRLTDAQGRTREETDAIPPVGGVATARRESVVSSLEFRVTGGDDRKMPWMKVRVIAPPELPAVHGLTLTVVPPAYTRWDQVLAATSPRPLPVGSRVQLLAGSCVQLAGKATKPLLPASRLRFEDGREFPLELDRDGLTFRVGTQEPSAPGSKTIEARGASKGRDDHASLALRASMAANDADSSAGGIRVTKSTGCAFHLVGVDGIEGGGEDGWQFCVVTDAPPSVAIERPAGDIFVTEKAVVDFRVTARDDLALNAVSLVFSASGGKAAKEQQYPIFPDAGRPGVSPSATFAAFEAGTTGDEETIERRACLSEAEGGGQSAVKGDTTVRLKLAELQLAPGMQLTCQAVASDYCPVKLPSPSGRGAGGEGHILPSPSGRGAGGEGGLQSGAGTNGQIGPIPPHPDPPRAPTEGWSGEGDRFQTTRSTPRVLTVITPEQFLERMNVRQSQIMAELVRVLQLQRDARNQVRILEIRLGETAGLEQAEVDRLQAAEFNQREVVRSLTSGSDGLPMQVHGLLADMESNRIDNADFQRRLEGLLAEFDRLQRERFTPIGTELTAAIKGSLVRLQSSPRPAGRDAENQSHLARAGEQQQQVIAALEGLLAGLRQWDDYRRFHREVAQLLRDQEEVARNTTALGAQTVSRDLRDLTPQETADLKAMAERQFELARRQARLEQEMEQTAAALGASEPLAATTLSDAVAEARRLAIAADMSSAGGHVQDNALGLAPAEQQRVLQGVQEVLDILANNRRQELTGLVKKLGEASGDLDSLRERQEGLRKKIEENAAPVGPQDKDAKLAKQKAELQKLAREQEELREQTQQLSRRLERLLAEDAATAANTAAGRMDEGRRAGDAGDGRGASGGAKAAEQALHDASQKLRQKRFELQVQLAMEQQAKLQDTIKHLRRQEEEIAKETREFADMERSGPLSRAQVSSVLELGRQQELLRDEAGRVTQGIDPANVFRIALSTVVDEMGRASALLQRRETGRTTQAAEQNAIERLDVVLTAMEPEEPDKTPGGGGPGDQARNNQNGGPPGGILPLSQLKLLKLLQEGLSLRTQQLHQAEAAGRPAEELRVQYARLLEEQGRLADLTFQLLRPQPAENAEPPKEADEAKEKRP